MAYATKYRLAWTTNAGSSIDWRLDIEQEAYSGTIQDVIGAGEPAVLEYVGDQDIYSPIIASKLNIDFLVTDDITYDDFTVLKDANDNIDALAYRVRLFHRPGGSDDPYTEYWRGFITPLDYEEAYTTTPYPASLIATDGLQLVSNAHLVPFGDGDPQNTVRVGEFLFDVIHNTGTQLPVKVYHDIRDQSDEYSIIETAVSDYAFHTADLSDSKTKVEAAKEILTAFNGRMFQANGYWNIISNSNHLATISSNSEIIPYKLYTYDTDSETWDDGVANTGDDVLFEMPTDIVPYNNSLVTVNRRPYFSIERRVTKQNGEIDNEDGGFNEAPSTTIDADGPVWRNRVIGNSSQYGNILNASNYGTTYKKHTDSDGRIGSGYVETTRTNKDGERDRTNWFEINIPYQNIKLGPATLVMFANQDWTNSEIDAATIGVQIAAYSDSGNYYYYDWSSNQFESRDYARRGGKNEYWNLCTTTNETKGEWNKFTLDISDLKRDVEGILGTGITFYTPGFPETVRIRIGSIRSLDADGSRRSGATGDVTTRIDAVFLTSQAEMEEDDESIEPFYEMYQPRFSETYQEPEISIYTDGYNGYRGKLGTTSFKRRGVTETKFLEEIVLQQKINDYYDSLLGYQGQLVNLKSRPFSLVDKIKNSFTGEADSVSCITKTMRYDIKSNVVDLTSYITNQDSDETATYSKEDVTPAVYAHNWRDTNINYFVVLDLTEVTLPATGAIETLTNGAVSAGATSITVDSTDDFPDAGWLISGTNRIRYGSKTATAFNDIPSTGSGAAVAIVDGSSIQAGVGSYIDAGSIPLVNNDEEEVYGKWYQAVHAGYSSIDTVGVSFDMFPTDKNQWEINGSNFSVTSFTDSDDADVDSNNIAITDTGTGVRVKFDFEGASYSEQLTMVMAGEVDAFTSPHVTFTVTDSSTANSNIAVTSVADAVVPESATEFLIVYVTPVSGNNEITLDNSSITVTAEDADDATLSGVIGTVSEVQFGTGVQYIIPVTAIPELDDIDFAVTATTTALPSGATTSTLTLNVSEAGDDKSNWTLQDTSLTATGVVGTDVEFFLEVNADPGYIITAVSSGSIEEAAHLLSRNKKITDYEWLSIQKCRFQADDTIITMTLDATTSDDDGDEVIHTIATPAAVSGEWSYTQNEDVEVGVDPGDTARVTITIEGDDGYDVNDIVFTVPAGDTWLELEGTTTFNVGTTLVTGKSFHFKITGQDSAQTSTLSSTGDATAVDIYGISVESNEVGFTGTDTIDSVLYDTGSVKITTTPVGNAFTVSKVSGTGVVSKGNGVVSFQAQSSNTPVRDLVFTVTHSNDSSQTATITAKQYGLVSGDRYGDVISPVIDRMEIVSTIPDADDQVSGVLYIKNE